MPSDKGMIKFGGVELTFIAEPEDTGGVNSVFEVRVLPGGKVPAPHYHESFDELIYGLEETLIFTVAGVSHTISAGDHCFVPRGAAHYFENHEATVARVLAVVTPALLGPAYFREIEAHVSSGPPDHAKIGEIMKRHGLIAVPLEPVVG